jgi:hypothetical protein
LYTLACSLRTGKTLDGKLCHNTKTCGIKLKTKSRNECLADADRVSGGCGMPGRKEFVDGGEEVVGGWRDHFIDRRQNSKSKTSGNALGSVWLQGEVGKPGAVARPGAGRHE